MGVIVLSSDRFLLHIIEDAKGLSGSVQRGVFKQETLNEIMFRAAERTHYVREVLVAHIYSIFSLMTLK